MSLKERHDVTKERNRLLKFVLDEAMLVAACEKQGAGPCIRCKSPFQTVILDKEKAWEQLTYIWYKNFFFNHIWSGLVLINRLNIC